MAIIIKDIIVVPIILIPFLIMALFKSSTKQRTEVFIGGSFVVMSIFFFRYFDNKEIAVLLFIIGVCFSLFLDEDYLNSRFNFIYMHTNPFCIKYWRLFQKKVRFLFSPLIEYKNFNYISRFFKILLAGVWLLLLGYSMRYLSKNIFDFLLWDVVSAFFFVVAYYLE